MENEKRYRSPATRLWAFMNEIFVECPKCKMDAMVTCSSWFPYQGAQLKCGNCMHSEKSSDLIRYRMIVKRNCDSCGKAFEVKVANRKIKTDTISISCPNCGITRKYEPRHEEYRLIYTSSKKAIDPVFGLPLWFKIDFRGNVFWAYNRQHLDEIRKYIGAKLRERQSKYFTTMVEKLPGFIKDAKNREALLRLIEKMEKRSSK